MRRFAVLCLVSLIWLSIPSLSASATAQANASCADFDAWEWAQSVFESDPQEYAALDPDGDGEACPNLPRGGFAPAFWTNSIPDDVEAVELIRLVDGDTMEVLIDGVSNRVRIYRADTPETQNEQHCGGQQATDYASFALSFNDQGTTLYLERDENTRDNFGRELAYVWFAVDGQPYMLNHIMINNGWAEDVDYGDRKYDDELKDAAAFAKRHDLGIWALCGAFGIPVEPAPPVDTNPGDGNGSGDGSDGGQQEPPVETGSGCDPNYTPCIPAYPPDLDCGEIGVTVTVIGGDPHGLDRDNDGVGCE